MVSSDYNEKVFPIHIPSILHGALVGMGSFWPFSCPRTQVTASKQLTMHSLLGYHGLSSCGKREGEGAFIKFSVLKRRLFSSSQFAMQNSQQGHSSVWKC
jgi:hypothetical protein